MPAAVMTGFETGLKGRPQSTLLSDKWDDFPFLQPDTQTCFTKNILEGKTAE